MKYLWIILTGMLLARTAAAQEESLLELIEEEPVTEVVTNAFKGSRAINAHSMEMIGAGVLDFRILHRFGRINQGYQQFFGLDQAAMRMGFDYGLTPNLTVGVGRSTYLKELDGFVKWRILSQKAGSRPFPFALIGVSGVTYNGLENPFAQAEVEPTAARRMAYYHQVIIGRKFSERLTLQLAPTLVHRNLVENRLQPNQLLALGVGGRFKITKRLALVADYSHALNRFPNSWAYNPLSIGVDIETGGHVFQLHFSNTSGMNERAFIAEPNGSWLQGDLQFGFNLSRVFQVHKPKRPF
ncbi:DUF5777 family beta-barrel protein [Phaeodactylibacter luteus]|uniref:DUF5777 domain-containing protein n=1 Tax=Phaeodactylibacter luteus TaxID=1564516 RepID=A0A5C6RIQ3_9BACT|nr:DUF5777 family beta-barrel protein [Phaeodactylibacter luteus]TXB62286.1 hypothetical protein FRY97_14655 [Phaeodactylibacter luteus]